jgi:hypothetical protein
LAVRLLGGSSFKAPINSRRTAAPWFCFHDTIPSAAHRQANPLAIDETHTSNGTKPLPLALVLLGKATVLTPFSDTALNPAGRNASPDSSTQDGASARSSASGLSVSPNTKLLRTLSQSATYAIVHDETCTLDEGSSYYTFTTTRVGSCDFNAFIVNVNSYVSL